MFLQNRRFASIASVFTLVLGVSACGGGQTSTTSTAANNATSPAANTETSTNVSGTIKIDGSSTVFPISEAVAEEFQKANPNARVTVAVSGTGGGFKRFCRGDLAIVNASRPITESEIKLCQQNNVKYVELPIAYDGIAVVTNPENDFAECLTVQQLKTIWEPAAQGKINNWRQINPQYPDRKLALFGPGPDSGTYDYFSEAIVGKEGASRGDYTASEDDNVLVQGVTSSSGALGFFGYAYYEENQNRLKLLGVDGGKGCVEPSPETIADGTYAPLSRPLFVYVSQAAAKQPVVREFVNFHLAQTNQKLVADVGYVPLPDQTIELVQNRFQKGITGTVFASAETGVSVKEVLQKEQ